MNENWIDVFMKQNGLWAERLQEVEQNGMLKSSAIARLIYSCEIGAGIDQHASEDLKEVSSQLEALRARVEAADELEQAVKQALPYLKNCAEHHGDDHVLEDVIIPQLAAALAAKGAG